MGAAGLSATRVSVEHLRRLLLLVCVAQVLLARGQVFGVDASWEQRGGLLLRHAGGDHHAVSRLEETKKKKKQG